ncbi:MAG TPA: ATP-dependent helicase [Cyanothece sp. UBA12306]|nr:ATP-dependent helicase [Cyanothece sp. UBA12306]
MKPSEIVNYDLRDYQINLIQDIYQQWKEGNTRVLAQLPTGAGKTICFAAIAREFACRSEKVIILAHREELVLQAADKLRKITEQDVGIIKAKYRPNYSLSVQVASVQSLVRRASVIEKVGLVIIDEAHHSTAKTYRQILERYPDAYQLGVTATPIRLDGVGFRDLFDELVCGLTIKELIKQKYLSRFRLYADPNPMSTKGVRMAQGDYSVKGLEKANNILHLSGQLIESYLEYAQGKRCLVFAININHSQMIAARYKEVGIPAFHLDGKTPDQERREAIEKFRKGEFLVLTNCQLFDEGLDIPGLEAVQIAKPTKSLTKWLQMVGRVLRPSEGKQCAVILDHTKNWAIHGLPNRERIWTLDGVEEKEKVQSSRKKNGEVVEEEILIAESETVLAEIDESIDEGQKIELNNSDETEKYWSKIYENLLYEQRANEYNKGWVYYRLKELNPPLFIWQAYGRLRGYHTKWATYRFQEQSSQSSPSSQPQLEFSPSELAKIFDIILSEFSPFTRVLMRSHTKLLTFNDDTAIIGARNSTILSLIRNKKAEIESVFKSVFNNEIKVHFTVEDSVLDE